MKTTLEIQLKYSLVCTGKNLGDCRQKVTSSIRKDAKSCRLGEITSPLHQYVLRVDQLESSFSEKNLEVLVNSMNIQHALTAKKGQSYSRLH